MIEPKASIDLTVVLALGVARLNDNQAVEDGGFDGPWEEFFLQWCQVSNKRDYVKQFDTIGA